MCGIAGIISLDGGSEPTVTQLEAMCDTLVHRGPDDEGIEVRGGVGLGMRRLSIIDLAGGRQPIFNEDRSVRLIFNGEIYNFRELRKELLDRGHRFSSRTDGEVIVHLWEEQGKGFLARLNGMFAFALHDLDRQQVLLVRDRLGIKPLFYSISPSEVVFGSEVKALLASGLVDKDLDPDGLSQFLAWEYIPAPRTMFKAIKKLEPGSNLLIDLRSGATTTSTWWDLLSVEEDEGGQGVLGSKAGARDWEDAIDAKVKECVQRQVVSDVPLGAFLSGGVDSSLVASAMGKARTFSIGFEDPSYDETPWSSIVARHLGLSHRVEILKPQVDELFDRLMPFMDDPIGDFSIFPTFLLANLAKEEVTVALTGDGGDEVFGGYDTYLAERAAETWVRVPSLIRRGLAEPLILALRPRPIKKGLVNRARHFVQGVQRKEALGHARWRLFADWPLQSELLTPEVERRVETPIDAHILRLGSLAAGRSSIDRCLFVDLRSYLVDNCLVKMDRMSMASSLEARVPLLDHELVEMAFAMPSKLKVLRYRSKPLLKQVAARHVPRDCVYRPKEGFSIPIKNWLRGPLRLLMEDLLSPQRLQREGIFQSPTVQRLKQEHLENRANHSHILWSLLVAQDWFRRWDVA